MSILEGSLALDVAAALEAADAPYDLVLNKRIAGTPVTWAPHLCRGWRDQFAQDTVDGTLIRATDVRVMIIAGSLDVEPTTSDRVTVNGVTYAVIVSVKRDPAGALWELQARS